MKLIFTSYTGSPEYTEPQKWLSRIAGYTGILESLSQNNHVVSIENINYDGECRLHGVDYIFKRQLTKTIRFPWKLHRKIKMLRPDVVFINGFIFPFQILLLRFQLGKTVRIVVFNRSEKPFAGYRRWLQRWADQCVDGYLFSSAEFGREWTRRGNISSQKKIYEVLHGSSIFAPDDLTTQFERQRLDSPLFLWVGRLDENKDPVTLIKSFIKFLGVKPDARLNVIYQTEELLPDITDLIAASGFSSGSIRLVGKVSHPDMGTWYKKSDFIISTSHFEGGGISVCEAMSCGCIPIVTDITSFRKMTGPGHCGLLYAPGNEEHLFKILLDAWNMDIVKEKRRTIIQFKKSFHSKLLPIRFSQLSPRFDDD